MTAPTTTTRPAHHVGVISPDDAPPVADLLARAFHDDPVVAWGIPDPARRPVASARSFAAILELYVPKRHVYADARRLSATLWAPPQDGQVRPADLVRLLPRLARVYRGRLPLVLAGLARVQRHRPEQPHWYLAYLGTDPDHQGQGLASAVLTPVLERCDRDGQPAYLEASKPELVPYYQRHGFEVVRELRLPAGPTVWCMWRAPRAT